MTANHQSVSLRKELITEIKKSICKSGRYVSIADFVREAVREKMERIDELCKEK